VIEKNSGIELTCWLCISCRVHFSSGELRKNWAPVEIKLSKSLELGFLR